MIDISVKPYQCRSCEGRDYFIHKSTGGRRCLPCSRRHELTWKRRNPERVKDCQLKTRYGITLAEFRGFLGAQNHQCAICSSGFEREQDAHIDHCHETNVLRGILCGPCNRAIGLLKESHVVAAAASSYLKQGGSIIGGHSIIRGRAS